MPPKAKWTVVPPEDSRALKHKILRCPPVRLRPHIVLSDQIHFIGIHWVSRRSVPCSGEETCPHCQKGYPTTKGYLAVWLPESNQRFCLELTPPCFDTAGAYRQLYGTLRGAQIVLTRKGTKDNGRMSAELQPSGIPPTQLPDAINVEETMAQAWDAPNKSDRTAMKTPRDDIGGQSAAEALIAKLQKAGFLDQNGEPIIRAKTAEPRPPKTNGDRPHTDLAAEAIGLGVTRQNQISLAEAGNMLKSAFDQHATFSVQKGGEQ